jgi:DNA/RNA-binding domain of Phe-tRNA-synthetase-like protein
MNIVPAPDARYQSREGAKEYDCQVTIDPTVFAQAPSFHRSAVYARKVAPADVPAMEDALRGTLRDFREGRCRLPDISWEELFRQFGINPKRYPPANVNLARRVQKGGELPFVMPIVAAMNATSLRYGLPVGGDDVARIAELGPVRLGLTSGGEEFQGLGDEAAVRVQAGELAYVAQRTVVCRFGFWRNSLLTKVTEQSEALLVNVDALGVDAARDAQEATEFLVGLLTGSCGFECRAALLGARSPTVTAGESASGGRFV